MGDSGKKIHDSVRVRQGQSFHGGSDVLLLPNYEPVRTALAPAPVSLARTLTLTDSHDSIISEVDRARARIWQIHLQSLRPFFHGKIKLRDEARELDMALVEWKTTLKDMFDMEPVLNTNFPFYLAMPLLRAVKLSPEYQAATAILRNALLRYRENFRTSLIVPLNNAMIGKAKMNSELYRPLKAVESSLWSRTEIACKVWRDVVRNVVQSIKGDPRWKSNEKLAARVHSLYVEALVLGWDEGRWKEVTPDGERDGVFAISDGPKKAIKYFEDYVQRHKTDEDLSTRRGDQRHNRRR